MLKAVTAYEVDGVAYAISVNPDNGKFVCITPTQDRVEAPSMSALKEKLKKLTRAKPVKLLVTHLSDDYDADQDRMEHGVITGVNARGQAIFIEDGETKPKTWYRDFYRRLTPEELEEHAELCKARDEAVAAIDEWLSARKIDVGEALAELRGEPKA